MAAAAPLPSNGRLSTFLDDKRRIALVETEIGSTSAIRYQFDNHLGTACLELDPTGAVITYEEYYPFGSTSYQAGRSVAEVSLKRYRYTGKERDNETGFYYHGARYYAPWLARWTATDASGLVDGTNLYQYCGNTPIRLSDPTGNQTADPIPVDLGRTVHEETKKAQEKGYTRHKHVPHTPPPVKPIPPPVPEPNPVPDPRVTPPPPEHKVEQHDEKPAKTEPDPKPTLAQAMNPPGVVKPGARRSRSGKPASHPV
jgi:RHS repeat-associated protein